MFLSFTDAGAEFVFGASFMDHFFAFRVRCGEIFTLASTEFWLCLRDFTGQKLKHFIMLSGTQTLIINALLFSSNSCNKTNTGV